MVVELQPSTINHRLSLPHSHPNRLPPPPPGYVRPVVRKQETQGGKAMEHRENPTSTGPPRARLLLVDDEPDLLSTLSEILEHHGYAVVSTLEGADAVEIASVFEPNVLVTDYSLPDIDGVTTIQ